MLIRGVLPEENEMRVVATICVPLVLLFLASCGSRLDISTIEVGPNNTVSWEDARTIIRDGDVKYVAQNHAQDVTIGLVDGSLFHAKEPKIDAVTDWLKACGKWGKVEYATE